MRGLAQTSQFLLVLILAATFWERKPHKGDFMTHFHSGSVPSATVMMTLQGEVQGCARSIQCFSLQPRGLSSGGENKAGSQIFQVQFQICCFLLGDLEQVIHHPEPQFPPL
jgi:hypothetical protein